MNVWVPLASALVSLIFSITLLDQYLVRRKPHQLIWAFGLFLYFLSTGSEFIMGLTGPVESLYRLWYLCGAMLVAAYLGLGTAYLLAPRRWAYITFIVLFIASAFSIIRVFSSTVQLGELVPGQVLHGGAFLAGTEGPRAMTPFLNVFGAIWLVGGAVWSAWEFWRRKILPHRVISNILIAFGALMPALGGTLSRFGVTQFLYLSELLGIIIIFIGFLRNKDIFGFYRVPLIHGFSPDSKKK